MGEKPILLYLPSGSSQSTAEPPVSGMQCKRYANSHDDGDHPMHLPAARTAYVLTRFVTESSAFCATADDVESDPRMARIELDTILSHRFARGQGAGGGYTSGDVRSSGKVSPILAGNVKIFTIFA